MLAWSRHLYHVVFCVVFMLHGFAFQSQLTATLNTFLTATLNTYTNPHSCDGLDVCKLN